MVEILLNHIVAIQVNEGQDLFKSHEKHGTDDKVYTNRIILEYSAHFQRKDLVR